MRMLLLRISKIVVCKINTLVTSPCRNQFWPFAIRELRMDMRYSIYRTSQDLSMLKPQDIVILVKILASMAQSKDDPYALLSQNKLATCLCMSVSEVNAGIKRLALSRLLAPVLRKGTKQDKMVFLPVKQACEECLISSVKYFIPVELGVYTRGIATSYAAPIMAQHILQGRDPIPVWPYAEGDQRGLALEPLYRSVPASIAKYPDQLFYEMLVLIDSIRSGRARERSIAIKLLKGIIGGKQ